MQSRQSSSWRLSSSGAAVIATVATIALTAIGASRAADPITSLDNPAVKYRPAKQPSAVLNRGGVEAIIITNAAGGDRLPQHRAGYSGVASLTHAKRRESLFVPAYAGLNFEHIHDGTTRDRGILFEPRRAPMQLRLIDEHTVELYQTPTPTWKLESSTRYAILPDGAIEMTFECIPRGKTFRNDYIGLFWASYIHQPESLDIHFRGSSSQKPAEQNAAKWIRGVTPAHGVKSTHVSANDKRRFEHDADFPLTLVFNRSEYEYREPWYYGVSHGMALAMMFRPGDLVRMSQSPSGGGGGNPAWDFQFFADNYQVGERYQMVVRALYAPYESREQMERATSKHRAALAK
ncbi:MAG: hypothetical protein QGG36_23325 [Pirellulaceae bacterium]|jgi:hypothetical protein|nr:hypothetical protein [Pirellulaceae bacterium]MDP7018751.1 hypothetical protein [Pirellulaceae bacterium]